MLDRFFASIALFMWSLAASRIRVTYYFPDLCIEIGLAPAAVDESILYYGDRPQVKGSAHFSQGYRDYGRIMRRWVFPSLIMAAFASHNLLHDLLRLRLCRLFIHRQTFKTPGTRSYKTFEGNLMLPTSFPYVIYMCNRIKRSSYWSLKLLTHLLGLRS